LLRRNDEREKYYGRILKLIGISPYRLAGRIHAPARRIHEIVLETGAKQRLQTYGCQDFPEIQPDTGEPANALILQPLTMLGIGQGQRYWLPSR
jgi:hypothetical protein